MSSFFTPIQPIKPMTFSDGKSESTGKTEGATPFSNVLKEAISEYEDLQQVTEQDAHSLAMGEADNLAQIQINSMKAQAALQTTVQLTSRVVNAYKEIMQMQV